MAIFVVLGSSDLEKLAKAVESVYAGQFFKLTDSQWFLVDKATTVEVSDKLGITAGEGINGVVLGITSYWGRANKQLWEWLASREASPNG